MKKNIVLGILGMCLVVASCNKEEFLDQPLRGKQLLDEFFTSEEKAELFINGVYQKINGEDWFQINFPRQINEMATDDNWSGNTKQPRADITGIAAYNVQPGSLYFNFFWEHQYIGITRANIALERIPAVEMEEDLKARLLAEASFLRAFFYFDLVRSFGGVPIITTFSEILESEINNTTRSTTEQVYERIEEDLKNAIPDLPLKSEYAAADLGRVTKGAAQAVLAKVYLYREKWSEAQRMALNVMQSGEYQLEPKFEDIWSVDNKYGVESILEVGYVNNPVFNNVGGHFSTTQGSRADRGWGWCTPTSDLENAFLSEGDVIRLRSTIIKHGDPVYGDPDVTEFNAVPTQNKSGRINRKFYIPKGQRPETYIRGEHPLSFINMRYADLVLIHAEAAYFNNDPGAALSSIKMIRDRVELPTDMSLSGDALRDAIWKERRLELALEQHRLFDLRRQKINGVPRIALIMGANGSFVKYNMEENTDPFETTNTGERQDKGINFDINTHLVWPIPPEEIQLSGGKITQNPGY